MGRDVGLERAVAEDQQREREQKQRLERHHEMAHRHQHRAENDGAMLSEQAIGDNAAEQRGQINEPGIEAIDVGGERLSAERTKKGFEGALEQRRAQ